MSSSTAVDMESFASLGLRALKKGCLGRDEALREEGERNAPN